MVRVRMRVLPVVKLGWRAVRQIILRSFVTGYRLTAPGLSPTMVEGGKVGSLVPKGPRKHIHCPRSENGAVIGTIPVSLPTVEGGKMDSSTDAHAARHFRASRNLAQILVRDPECEHKFYWLMPADDMTDELLAVAINTGRLIEYHASGPLLTVSSGGASASSSPPPPRPRHLKRAG